MKLPTSFAQKLHTRGEKFTRLTLYPRRALLSNAGLNSS